MPKAPILQSCPGTCTGRQTWSADRLAAARTHPVVPVLLGIAPPRMAGVAILQGSKPGTARAGPQGIDHDSVIILLRFSFTRKSQRDTDAT